MDVSLQNHQPVIRQLRKIESNRDVIALFNEVILILNKTIHNQTDGFKILSTICFEMAGLITLKPFNNPEIMNHEFFIILKQTFQTLLTKLTFISLGKQDEQCIDGISLLIANLCLYKNTISTCFYTDNNEELNPINEEKFSFISYEKIFFTDSFLKRFVRILEDDIAVHSYDKYHIKYKIVDRLLRLCIKLNDIDKKVIIDSIVKCVESKTYMNLYQTVDLGQPILSPKESFFLFQCPKFIRLCSFERQDEISNKLSKSIIKYHGNIFEKNLSNILIGEFVLNSAIASYVELLNHIALTSTTRELFIKKFDTDKTVVDQMIEILKGLSSIESIYRNTKLFHADVALMSYSIALLYNLTFERKIFYELRTRNVKDICKELYKAKDKTIQFASRTLAVILNQEDIDSIDSPSKVADSYLYFIENTIDNSTVTHHGIKLDGVLINLEVIIQSDVIKDEIINHDNGILLLARCAYEPNLDNETIQHPALRIIDAVSFGKDSVVKQIKENDALMNHIRELCDTNDKYQVVTAKRILWKVDEELKFVSTQEQQKQNEIKLINVFDEKKAIYQYIRGDHYFSLEEHKNSGKFNLMISYCQEDKDICLKIYNRLTTSDCYKVAFDKDNLHTANPKAMAKTVENSSIILICFSTKYQNSYASRLEAEYTMKRNRPIIPIKIDHQYNSRGWLKEIIDKEKYIDFTKYEFNTSFTQLIDQINELRENLRKL
ncbi:unnamed protein product [Rotaria socialis]|uniref:TIR domain-containing protein n=1 Tax=Rotaria socialis TaxID=392032 RepID=A0A818FSZ7_9BILA|nr:unnamed protein product [Rotaria socialis]CAF4459512.1 unnamed protein product [Rotaria socialis]